MCRLCATTIQAQFLHFADAKIHNSAATHPCSFNLQRHVHLNSKTSSWWHVNDLAVKTRLLKCPEKNEDSFFNSVCTVYCAYSYLQSSSYVTLQVILSPASRIRRFSSVTFVGENTSHLAATALT